MAGQKPLPVEPQAESLGAPAPPTEEQRRERLERYNDVVERAELSIVQLTSLSYEVKSSYFEEEKAKKNRTEFDYAITTDDVIFDAERGVAGVYLSCEAGAKKGKKKKLVACKAKYVVAYKNLVGCDQEATAQFLRRVGRFACYPYFRSLFATLDWSAGAGMPILPVLKEPAKPSKPPS